MLEHYDSSSSDFISAQTRLSAFCLPRKWAFELDRKALRGTVWAYCELLLDGESLFYGLGSTFAIAVDDTIARAVDADKRRSFVADRISNASLATCACEACKTARGERPSPRFALTSYDRATIHRIDDFLHAHNLRLQIFGTPAGYSGELSDIADGRRGVAHVGGRESMADMLIELLEKVQA
jgi:hypothetical protein